MVVGVGVEIPLVPPAHQKLSRSRLGKGESAFIAVVGTALLLLLLLLGRREGMGMGASPRPYRSPSFKREVDRSLFFPSSSSSSSEYHSSSSTSSSWSWGSSSHHRLPFSSVFSRPVGGEAEKKVEKRGDRFLSPSFHRCLEQDGLLLSPTVVRRE